MIGFFICVAIAAIASILGGVAPPIIGAPVFAILIGASIAAIWRVPERFKPGIAFASKALLQWSIVLLGFRLSLKEIVGSGEASLPVMLGTMIVVLVLAYVVGRMLGLDRNLRRLLGVGTAICGGSAIAAVSSVIEADAADISYALGAVFLFNVVAVIVFPPLGHLMLMSQNAFGLWAGTAINDTSSVVAASFVYGAQSATQAVIVKLTRTTLIIPIVLFYVWRRYNTLKEEGRRVQWLKILPLFILWFLLAAALNSAGVIPHAVDGPLQQIAVFSIVVALAGVGLGTEVEKIRTAGWKPLLLGAVLWGAISVASLALARAFGLG